MVEQLITMSQQRQKIIARHFSTFVKNLFHEIYRLIVENEQQEKVIDVAGDFVQIDPRSWKEKRDVVVSLHLGYNEQEKEADEYIDAFVALGGEPD